MIRLGHDMETRRALAREILKFVELDHDPIPLGVLSATINLKTALSTGMETLLRLMIEQGRESLQVEDLIVTTVRTWSGRPTLSMTHLSWVFWLRRWILEEDVTEGSGSKWGDLQGAHDLPEGVLVLGPGRVVGRYERGAPRGGHSPEALVRDGFGRTIGCKRYELVPLTSASAL
jgi:hypothetical protein